MNIIMSYHIRTFLKQGEQNYSLCQYDMNDQLLINPFQSVRVDYFFNMASLPWVAGGGVENKGGEVRGDVLLRHPDVHAPLQLCQQDHPVRPVLLHLGHKEHHLYGEVICAVVR